MRELEVIEVGKPYQIRSQGGSMEIPEELADYFRSKGYTLVWSKNDPRAFAQESMYDRVPVDLDTIPEALWRRVRTRYVAGPETNGQIRYGDACVMMQPIAAQEAWRDENEKRWKERLRDAENKGDEENEEVFRKLSGSIQGIGGMVRRDGPMLKPMPKNPRITDHVTSGKRWVEEGLPMPKYPELESSGSEDSVSIPSKKGRKGSNG